MESPLYGNTLGFLCSLRIAFVKSLGREVLLNPVKLTLLSILDETEVIPVVFDQITSVFAQIIHGQRVIVDTRCRWVIVHCVLRHRSRRNIDRSDTCVYVAIKVLQV